MTASSVELIPALLVALPILASTLPLLFGLRWPRVGWPVAAVVCTGLLGLAIALAVSVHAGGRVIHQLGGFPRPAGIELVADDLSSLIALLVAGMAAGVLAYTRIGGPRGNAFYSGYLLLVGGLLGVTLTGDVFNLFVFLEITGLATYMLIAKGNSPESAVAALKYLFIGTVGASIYLIGVGLLLLATGTLNMIDLATAIPETAGYDDPLVLAAFAFVFVGFAIKVAIYPLHTWQPDAYQRAPDGVTPLISALVSTVSAYAFARVTFDVFTVDFLAAVPLAADIVVTMGAVSVLAGSTLAVIQADVKRMLAYSSVSQFGLVVAAYGLVNETALLGAFVHLVGHGIMKGGLFVAVGVVAAGTGARTVDEYAGLAKRRPLEAGALSALGLALVGIPPSVGFLGKWFIGVGAVEAGVWPVAAVIFLSTMLTLAYVARLLEKMYFTPTAREPRAPAGARPATDGGERAPLDAIDEDAQRVSYGMLAVAVLSAVAAIGLGFVGAGFEALLGEFVGEVFAGG